MDKSNDINKQNISRFIDYLLSLLLYGFDEMEMQKRLEIVKLSAYVFNVFIENNYRRMLNLENRIKSLEEQMNKKN